MRSVMAGVAILFGCWLTSGCTPKTPVELMSPEGGAPSAPASYKYGRNGAALPASGAWWEQFRDPVLDRLMEDVEEENPDVRAALARVDQANAVLGITGAELLPTAVVDGGFTTNRDSANSLRFAIDELEFDNYRIAGNATWEIDLWGRVRGAYSRDRSRAVAAREDYHDVLLSLRAMLARNYFAHHYVDREIDILEDAVVVRERALRLQTSLAQRGGGTGLDVARARTELESTRAEAEGLRRLRGKLENAIAALTGRPPSDLSLEKKESPVRLPRIPPGLPSDLLARRPDLRSAEAGLRAASLEVGVTKADFLPRITLTGTGGFLSLKSSELFAGSDSFFYSLGPRIDVPVFQAGRRQSEVSEAKAKWDESAASYRAALLAAVQEVDDALLDLNVLGGQAEAQRKAVEAAAKVTELAQKRFDRGAASYFEVVDAQRTELDARRTENNLHGERAGATVQLIQALGGEW